MSRLNLLIAVPVRASLAAGLMAGLEKLLASLAGSSPNGFFFDVETAVHVNEPVGEAAGGGRWLEQARARNELVERYLRPEHDLVFWLDADIVECDPWLPAYLYLANPAGITAPLVLIEGTKIFYDLFGFIRGGRRANQEWPYFPGFQSNGNHHDPSVWEPSFVPLDAVGCCYLMPAWLLREGARYESRPPDGAEHESLAGYGYTDHWPVMQAARAAGLPVGCVTSRTAYHANLAKWGEAFH